VAALVVVIVAVVALLALGLSSRASSGPYPDRLRYGLVVIAFSAVDRISYLLAIAAAVVGVLTGIVLIWDGGAGGGVLGKVAGTSALVLGGSLLVLMLNRLMRGRPNS
jgi:hypothetical protein